MIGKFLCKYGFHFWGGWYIEPEGVINTCIRDGCGKRKKSIDKIINGVKDRDGGHWEYIE